MKDIWDILKGLGVLIIIGYLFNSCSNASGPQYPLDQNNERAEYLADMSETDNRNYDPASQYDSIPTNAPDTYESLGPNDSLVPETSSCPNGCATHINGCDIKGNIGFDSGAKIYHLPGQKFYASTDINPAYGERWFCTEAEATANGWRKSYQ